jgi:hypothetical protein
MALVGNAVLSSIGIDQIYLIPAPSFAVISNFSALSAAVFGAATIEQLGVIRWVAPIHSGHLFHAIETHRLRLIDAWTTQQLDFWTGDLTTTQNIVYLKASVRDRIIFTDVNKTSDPGCWTWLHVLVLSADGTIRQEWWGQILPQLQPQALRGLFLQPKSSFKFLEGVTASMAQYFTPDVIDGWHDFWRRIPPDAIPGFSSSVYENFNSVVLLDSTQAASMDPGKIVFLSCNMIKHQFFPLLNATSTIKGYNHTFWYHVRPELVSAFRDSLQRCHVNWTIPDDASTGPLIIPPPYTDNRYTWNVSAPVETPKGINPTPSAPAEASPDNGADEQQSILLWRTLAVVFMALAAPMVAFLIIVCVRNRALNKQIQRAADLSEDDRRPLLNRESPSLQSRGTIWDRAVLLERLGAGGSGAQIFRCSVQGLTCAAKVLDCAHAFEKQVDEFSREVDVLIEASQRSDWVVKYLYLSYNPVSRKFIIFMEFFPGTLQSQITQMRRLRGNGSIDGVGNIDSSPSIRFSAATIGRIGHGILSGLKALHNYSKEDAATAGTNPARKGMKKNKPIIHRDLKPGNVFAAFDEVGDVVLIKLGDFGISKLLSATNQARTAMMGTPGYMAPEVITAGEGARDKTSAYTTAADMYSFGMILYELMTLQAPYSDVESEAEKNKLILSGQLPMIPLYIEQDEEYAELIEVWRECVQVDASRRPTASQLLEQRVFKSWVSS